jgi:hypothetical protein
LVGEGIMAELDFSKASIDEVLQVYFADGSVLLRNFASPKKLSALKADVDRILDQRNEIHLYDREMEANGLPHFSDYIFDEKHRFLLQEVFGNDYRISGDTATRRIDATANGNGWQLPLNPHLDAFVHHFSFTVNFWVPFRECGKEAPSLGVVCAPYSEVLQFAGYDGGPQHNGGASVWNYPNFSNAPFNVDDLYRVFGGRVWTPEYGFGDAMMLSNWTLHFTHSVPGMLNRRGNVELRFISDTSLDQILARHARRPRPSKLPGIFGSLFGSLRR